MPTLNPSDHSKEVENFYSSTSGLPQDKRDKLTREYIERRRRQSFKQRLDSIQSGALNEQLLEVPAEERSYGKHPYPRQVSLIAARHQLSDYRRATNEKIVEAPTYTAPVEKPLLSYEEAVRKGRLQLVIGLSLLCSSICGITLILDALNQ